MHAADVLVPKGYRVEAVAQGLTFPTGVCFDQTTQAYVVEAGYSYGEVWTKPRLLRIEAGGQAVAIAAGGTNGPWIGVVWHEGNFYVAEGGTLEGGRILKISPQGAITLLASNLPSMGDHHVNGPALGPDGWLYLESARPAIRGWWGKTTRSLGG